GAAMTKARGGDDEPGRRNDAPPARHIGPPQKNHATHATGGARGRRDGQTRAREPPQPIERSATMLDTLKDQLNALPHDKVRRIVMPIATALQEAQDLLELCRIPTVTVAL